MKEGGTEGRRARGLRVAMATLVGAPLNKAMRGKESGYPQRGAQWRTEGTFRAVRDADRRRRRRGPG